VPLPSIPPPPSYPATGKKKAAFVTSMKYSIISIENAMNV
jgi:hypothetical protein